MLLQGPEEVLSSESVGPMENEREQWDGKPSNPCILFQTPAQKTACETMCLIIQQNENNKPGYFSKEMEQIENIGSFLPTHSARW